jgi:hypothetical protein
MSERDRADARPGCGALILGFLSISLVGNFLLTALWSLGDDQFPWDKFGARLVSDIFIDIILVPISILFAVLIIIRLWPSNFSRTTRTSPGLVVLAYVLCLPLFFVLSAPTLAASIWVLGVLHDTPIRHSVLQMTLYFVSIPMQVVLDAVYFWSHDPPRADLVSDPLLERDLYWVARVWAWLASFLAVSGTAKVAWDQFRRRDKAPD